MHHFKHHRGPYLDDLWVVTMISNPMRYRSRYDLYEKFRTACAIAGAKLLTVEVAFGERPFEITQSHNPHHVQLRTNTELWHKENAINIGISRLPSSWKYVAWIDADVEFMRADWLDETIHQLQHYDVIQMFQNAIDLGPNGEVMKVHDGFAYSYKSGKIPPTKRKVGYIPWHPGYCWAARRSAIDALGGLFDKGILGAGDAHLAWSLIGRGFDYAPEKISPAYRRELSTYQDRANTHIRQNIGYMPGTIYHHFHGKKKDRRYLERWQILFNHNYDPDQDLKFDWQRLYQFSDKGLRMRSDFQKYFRQRNEDSIDL